MNRVIVALGAVMVLSITCMDYGLAWKAHAGAPYSVMDHARDRLAGLAIPGLGAKTNALAAILPPAPEGFTARPATALDAFAVIGREPSAQELENADKLETAFQQMTPGHQTERRFYQNGDQMALVELTFIPFNQRNSRGVTFADGLQAQLVATGSLKPAMTLGDAKVYNMTDTKFGNAVVYSAKFSDQGYIGVTSALGPKATEALLNSVDFKGFAALVEADPTRNQPDAPLTEADVSASAEGAQVCVRKAGKRVCSPAK